MASGWKGSTRKERLPRDWQARRRAVIARDGGQCTWELLSGARCPIPGTDVDHVVRGDDHELTNLRLLCGKHHQAKSSLEGGLGNKAKLDRRLRPEEPHPGRRI